MAKPSGHKTLEAAKRSAAMRDVLDYLENGGELPEFAEELAQLDVMPELLQLVQAADGKASKDFKAGLVARFEFAFALHRDAMHTFASPGQLRARAWQARLQGLYGGGRIDLECRRFGT